MKTQMIRKFMKKIFILNDAIDEGEIAYDKCGRFYLGF